MAEKPGFENSLICPYNRAHVILKSRMQFHLTKCRKNYPLEEKVQCSFNSTHIINKVELEFHHQYCPDRTSLDLFMYDIGDTACAVRDLIPINSVEMPAATESWDDEVATGSVLDFIKEQAESKRILRHLTGSTRTQRKHFRMQERIRYQNLETEEQSQNQKEASSRRYPRIENQPTGMEQTLPCPDSKPVKMRQAAALNPPLPTVGHGRNRLLSPVRDCANGGSPPPKVNEKGKQPLNNNSLTEDMQKLNITPGLNVHTGEFMVVASSRRSKHINNNTDKSTVKPCVSDRVDDISLENSLKAFKFPTSEEGFCQVPIPGSGRGRGRRPT